MQQNFGVGPGGKGVPGAHQLGGQLLEVINLTVKDDGKVLVLIEHGLFAALQVNDGKAALAKGCRAFNKLALAIGAAVGDGIHHALQNFLHVGAYADKANNSTHGYNPQLAAALKNKPQVITFLPRREPVLFVRYALLYTVRAVKKSILRRMLLEFSPAQTKNAVPAPPKQAILPFDMWCQWR